MRLNVRVKATVLLMLELRLFCVAFSADGRTAWSNNKLMKGE